MEIERRLYREMVLKRVILSLGRALPEMNSYYTERSLLMVYDTIRKFVPEYELHFQDIASEDAIRMTMRRNRHDPSLLWRYLESVACEATMAIRMDENAY